MTDRAKQKPMRGRGVSRRDFLLGRVWLAGNAASAVDEAATVRSGVGSQKPRVMRYPKSLRDVSAATTCEASRSTSGPAPAPAVAARRRTIPVQRPPGAIDEANFLAGCTRCERCIEACPHQAIVHAPERLREAAGTPMIDVDRQPCLMCADFPCISACEPGVLSAHIPAVMGTARITEQLCLPHHGVSCTVCSERCPVENAIVIHQGKPTVNEATCSGCGVCRWVCPAPENAILLMPMFVRPAPQGKKQSHV